MNKPLKAQFEEVLLETYRLAKKEYGYNATIFFRMISEFGGVGAAQRLLYGNNAGSGFTELYELGRLDLTIEAQVLRPEFAPLFSSEELETARRRLAALGYTPPTAST